MINYSAAIVLALLAMPEGSRRLETATFVALRQVQYPTIAVQQEIGRKVLLNNKTQGDPCRESMNIIAMEQEADLCCSAEQAALAPRSHSPKSHRTRNVMQRLLMNRAELRPLCMLNAHGK